MTEYALRGFTESPVADVEQTYWDLALARREIEIVDESLNVDRQQLTETRQLNDVGQPDRRGPRPGQLPQGPDRAIPAGRVPFAAAPHIGTRARGCRSGGQIGCLSESIVAMMVQVSIDPLH